MTLGTGIFASTVLVLLAIAIWQITARHKWKLTGKIAAGFLAVCTVIGGGLYAWNYVSDLPPAPYIVTELVGVKLGMSPTDVTLALGRPETATDPTMEDGETRQDFNYLSPDIRITFYGPDKYTIKAAIICTSDNYTDLLGYNNFASEESIFQRLGRPSATSVSNDGLAKIISYSHWKVAFKISKGFVSEKCITKNGVVRFTDEKLSLEEQKVADQKAAEEATLAKQKIASEARRAAEMRRRYEAMHARELAELKAVEAYRLCERRRAIEIERGLNAKYAQPC